MSLLLLFNGAEAPPPTVTPLRSLLGVGLSVLLWLVQQIRPTDY